MSRIGRRPIAIPEQVRIDQADGEVRVQGPRGRLSQRIPRGISLEIAEGQIRLLRSDERRPTRALHGLTRALVANMVQGVTGGFRKELEMRGVGYRAELRGRSLSLQVGFSHPVVVSIPEEIDVSLDTATKIRIEGISRERVGQFASDLRRIRPPEPYKGKGIRYAGEQVRRKVGKAGAT